jgi:hypothetical protein
MADKHPYTSGSGGLVQAVNQLRKAFPAQVSAETLRKLGIAPNNETYVINILRYIGVIDADGKKTNEAGPIFSKHEDSEFQKAFADLVKSSYSDLFDLHGNEAWSLPSDKLISFFRGTDQTSAIVGQRQAGTFQTLAGLAGQMEIPSVKPAPNQKKVAPKSISGGKSKEAKVLKSDGTLGKIEPPNGNRDLGLTVRIEINLPVAADQETYDRIFKSIRENLING